VRNSNQDREYVTRGSWIPGATSGSIALGLILFLSHAVSVAQEIDAAEQSGSQGIEEIIVTARKRESALQDVSLSVTALPETELVIRNIDDFLDYISYVPGVFANEAGSAGPRGGARLITIRGIVPGPGDNAFGFYLDESPLFTSDPKLFDLSRIEVLRGPQGTLYGQGTSGGAIKIVTNQPDLSEFQAKFLGETYSVQDGELGYQANVALNFPLVDDVLGLRIVGMYRDEAGYIDRVAQPAALAAAFGPQNAVNALDLIEEDFNTERVTGFRMQLRYEPSANLSITPAVFYQKTDVGGRQTYQPLVGDLQEVRERNNRESEEVFHASMRLKYRFNWAELTFVSTYMEQNGRSDEDVSGFIRGIFEPLLGPIAAPSQLAVYAEGRNIVQEIRLASPVDRKFRWLVGAYFDDREREGRDEEGRPLLTGITPGFSSLVPSFFTDDIWILVGGHFKSNEKSLFGEVEYDLTERLTATIGLRYIDFEVDNLVRRAGILGGASPPTDLNYPVNLPTASRNTGIKPKFSLAYDVTDDILLFATAAEGFRRGGPNAAVPAATCADDLAGLGLTAVPDTFAPDSLWSYELGVKSAWFDNRLIANVTAFHIALSDVQQSVFLPTCRFSFTANVGEARSQGFELETVVQPFEGVELSLAVGLTDTEITDIPEAFQFGAQFQEGERLAMVPEWSVSGYAQKMFPLLDGTKNGYVRFEYQYLDSRVDNAVDAGLESFEVMNVRIGLIGEKWSVQIFGENIADSRPDLFIDSFTGGASYPTGSWTLRPRSFGVQVSAGF